MTNPSNPVSNSVIGLPKTLRILGKRFHIRLLKDDEEIEVDGLMELNKQQISIRPQQALEQVQDTSLHECLHAISDSLSLDLSESQVHQLAAAILALLKDNRAYSKWLLKDDE